MKRRNEAGFSLIEILVAIVILAAVVLPVCSALVLSVRMNERTDELMQSQLAVSSAVENLMAEGIPEDTAAGAYGSGDRFPGVDITIDSAASSYYQVTVASRDGLVSVTTSIGFAESAGEGG